MKAIGCEIFGGSQTIGHLQSGWNVDRILEMTDDMTEYNAYHFTKNYPNIPIIKFSEWHNDNYLSKLGEYDLLFANNPCSGLSSINRNASVDNNVNEHFYEVLLAINTIKPKAFLIENAPTLTGLGLPILKDLQLKLKDNYKLLIINDLAGNHNVAMYRRRTLIMGFRRDFFNNCVANIDAETQPMLTVNDAFKGLTNDTPNMEPDIYAKGKSLMQFYYLVPNKCSIMEYLAKEFDNVKNDLDDTDYKIIEHYKERLAKKGHIWDKSAWRLSETYYAPSMTSLSQYIHPTENRDLYIREYARLMGYPDDFIFYQDECKCSTIQCLAQGVPVNFIKYASNEIIKAFNGNLLDIDGDVIYINQCSGIQKRVIFTTEEFQKCSKISENNITTPSLWF